MESINDCWWHAISWQNGSIVNGIDNLNDRLLLYWGWYCKTKEKELSKSDFGMRSVFVIHRTFGEENLIDFSKHGRQSLFLNVYVSGW